MYSFKEFILSVLESAKDRLKNPFIGTFVISWIAINWRFISILFFSSKIIEQRITYIECNYFDINYNLWYPLIFAVFYVLILPYLMALFESISQKAVSIRRLISKNLKIKDIQFRQEIAAEEWQLEKIKEGSPDIKALKEKIIELENYIEDNTDAENNSSENNDSEKTKEKSEENKQQVKTTKRRSRRGMIKAPTTNKESVQSEENKKELGDYPSMKEILIRDLAKTEREWILIYALYSSDFGKNVFTREVLVNKYNESNRKTDSRLKNLSNNIRNMVKSGQLKYINDEEILLTSSGVEMANEILNR